MPLFFAAIWAAVARRRRQQPAMLHHSPSLAVMLVEELWLFAKRWSPVILGGSAAACILVVFASRTPGPVVHVAPRSVIAAVAFAVAWILATRHRGVHR